MPILETIGLVLGCIGFAGQIGHYISKFAHKRLLRRRKRYEEIQKAMMDRWEQQHATRLGGFNEPHVAGIHDEKGARRGSQWNAVSDLVKLFELSFRQNQELTRVVNTIQAQLHTVQQSMHRAFAAMMREQKAHEIDVLRRVQDQFTEHLGDVRHMNRMVWIVMSIIAVLTFCVGFLIAERSALQNQLKYALQQKTTLENGNGFARGIPNDSTATMASLSLFQALRQLLGGVIGGFLFMPRWLLHVIAWPFNVSYTILSLAALLVSIVIRGCVLVKVLEMLIILSESHAAAASSTRKLSALLNILWIYPAYKILGLANLLITIVVQAAVLLFIGTLLVYRHRALWQYSRRQERNGRIDIQRASTHTRSFKYEAAELVAFLFLYVFMNRAAAGIDVPPVVRKLVIAVAILLEMIATRRCGTCYIVCADQQIASKLVRLVVEVAEISYLSV